MNMLQLLQPRGQLDFNMLSDGMVEATTGQIASKLQVHVFTVDLERTRGEIKESDEMAPRWWDWDHVPLDDMWADDKFWLPLVLSGADVRGDFTFQDQSTIVAHTLQRMEEGAWAAGCVPPCPADTGHDCKPDVPE